MSPFDFVIDPYSRVMFWTDASSNQINACRLNGTNIGVVVREGQPRHIAIAAELGLVMISDGTLSVFRIQLSSVVSFLSSLWLLIFIASLICVLNIV